MEFFVITDLVTKEYIRSWHTKIPYILLYKFFI